MSVLRTALAEGVDVVVLTDHNTIDGYLSVKGELSSLAPLVVLPGVEVTCRGGASGIHVLGVFDDNHLDTRLSGLLAQLGLGPADRSVNGLSEFDIVGTCDAIHEIGGLAIAAHAASSKGVLHELRGLQLQRLMADCPFDAVELSTPEQLRRGREALARIGLLGEVPIVSGTDSHRALHSRGSDRPDGPGTRPTVLRASGANSVATIREALPSAIPVQDRLVEGTPLRDILRGERSDVAVVWRADDRHAVTRAVAAMATSGRGSVYLGVRRGGRGGAGVVVHRSIPHPFEIERWIWQDVEPVPAIRFATREHKGREFVSVEIPEGLNPFVYSADERVLEWFDGKPRRPRAAAASHAQLLRSLRQFVDDGTIADLRATAPELIAPSRLEGIFPWRGYLDHNEHTAALSAVVRQLARGTDSAILRGWAYSEHARVEELAVEHVKRLTRDLGIAEAKRGLRKRLDEIGTSRTLTKRVIGAFENATSSVSAAEPEDMASRDVVENACRRIDEAIGDAGLGERMRKAAVDEGKRVNEMLAVLVSDTNVEVILEALVDEESADTQEPIRAALIDARTPLHLDQLTGADALAERDVVLVGTTDADGAGSRRTLVAVPAPVKSSSDLLRSHEELAKFNPGHVIPHDELLQLIEVRRELAPTEAQRLTAFRSAVRARLPAWWVTSDDLSAELLAGCLIKAMPSTRSGQELERILRCLALIPGDHEKHGDSAAAASRARGVHEMRDILRQPWDERVHQLAVQVHRLDELEDGVVRLGGQAIEHHGQTIVQALRAGSLRVQELSKPDAEAVARALPVVPSETIFHLFVLGIRNKWQTASALLRFDEATFGPSWLRSGIRSSELLAK